MNSGSLLSPSTGSASGAMHGKRGTCRDEAVVFGEYQHLIGVLRTPDSRTAVSDLAVLMITPGMLPSPGPYGLHVDLAKSLSDIGIPSLRFDLSGIGESLAVGAEGTSLERAAAEITCAIDWLARRGVRRVALFGLCSGADDAMFAAQSEPRIVGLFAMDGCGYRTHRFHWHRLVSHYLPRLASPRKWGQLLRTALGARSKSPSSLQLGSDIREFPSREAASQQLKLLEQRGVRMHFHYTGGVSDYYNHGRQFAVMFPELGCERVTSSFEPSCDHTAFLCEHRSLLVKRVTRFFESLILSCD